MKSKEDPWVVVFDVDGVLTDGTFYNTKKGKFLKRFGPDDWDSIRELQHFAEIQIVTADKKGYSIVEKRIAEEMGLPLALVPNKPPQSRWRWIIEKFAGYDICYVGDGLYDWYCMEEADYSMAPADALLHIKERADYVSEHTGARRFVADACLHFMDHIFNLDTWYIGGEGDE